MLKINFQIKKKIECEFMTWRMTNSHAESQPSICSFLICPFCTSLHFQWELLKFKASKGIHSDFVVVVVVYLVGFWNHPKAWQLFPVMLPNIS